jgi:hypothetical protein
MKMLERNVKQLIYWVAEREAIREKRAAGLPKPWTKDSILRSYRFCNVCRRDDTVTQWIEQKVIARYETSPLLWLQLALARYVNWPGTLTALMEVGLWPEVPARVNLRGIGEFIDERAGIGEKTWTGAYMIRAESNPNAEWYDWGKGRYVAEIVIGGLWERRKEVEPKLRGSIREAHETLMTGYGWGSFMSGQVVADLAYSPHWLALAPDVNTYAPLGPGSRRGLNRLLARPLSSVIRQDDACLLMRMLRARVMADLGEKFARLNLHDIQNCLCEFDKYQRVKLGEGQPRSGYKGY